MYKIAVIPAELPLRATNTPTIDSMNIVHPLLVAIVPAALYILLYMRRRNASERVQVRAMLQRWWLFGFDIAFQFASWVDQGVALQESAKWIENHGRTFSVTFAGHTSICTADEANAMAVLTSDDFELSTVRRNAFYPVVGNGMIATNGLHAIHGRKILRRVLTQRASRDFASFEVHVRNLFALLPVDGRTVNLQQVLPLLTMDISSELLLGQSTSWLEQPQSGAVQLLSRALDYVTDVMRFRTDLGPFVHVHWNRCFKRDCKLLHQFVESYITSPTEPMIKGRASYGSALMSSGCDINLTRGHVLTSILAGRDTTASLMGFVIWTLALHPAPQAKLRQAIAGLTTEFTYADLRQVEYLWCTINEVLRLFPSIPANERAAKRDTFIPTGGGADGEKAAFVPQGCVVDIHTWAIHRDRSVWGDSANDFIPERWEGRRHQKGYMPFGAGARTCPGQDLALNQTAYLVTRLLQTYPRLESEGSISFREKVTITLGSANGLKVTLGC